MITLTFACLVLFLLNPETASTSVSRATLDDYKSYIRGRCSALGLNPDLSALSFCWNDASASAFLSYAYKGFHMVASSSPEQIPTVLKTYYSQEFPEHLLALLDAFECEKKQPYAQQINEKLGIDLQNVAEMMSNTLHYAAAQSENCFYRMRCIPSLLEQGNFEAAGILDANFLIQVSAFKRQEGTHWQGRAWNNRYLFMKGLCKALNIKCPLDSMPSCWNNETSAAYLQFAYEWVKTISSNPVESTSSTAREYLDGRGKELMNNIPASVLECDRKSQDIVFMKNKLGYDVWSKEWMDTFVEYAKELPESYWLYKASAYELFQQGEYESIGMIIGLERYHVAEWKKGKSDKKVIDDL